jgi:hypothetical protein
LIVYTAIMGSRRDLLRPIVAPPDPKGRPIQYVCFSDIARLPVPPGWEIRPPLWRHENPRRTARWHKTMAHRALGDGLDYSLWIDATNQLQVNPWELVDRYLADGREMAVCRHPDRRCVYDELKVCIQLVMDDPAIMQQQIARYRAEGYPPRMGLYEMAVVLRAHTPKIQEFNERCWAEICAGSYRDQLCANYVAWKMKLPVAYLAGYRACSPYFTFYPHRPATAGKTARQEGL